MVLLRQDEPPDVWWFCRGESGEGWIPLAFMDVDGAVGTLRRDYTTRELSIGADAVVTVLESVGGWSFVVDAGDRTGWVMEADLVPIV